MFLKSKAIDVKHGFFTRQGGISNEPFASLNCGFGHGDSDENVNLNRHIALKAIGGEILVSAKQIHSDIALIVNGPGKFEADALITNKIGVALAVYTADCVPILMCDAKNGIIAAVHSGWRGALAGVTNSAIQAMRNLGAENIIAAIGPCIQQKSYEVSEEFLDKFIAESTNNQKYFVAGKTTGHRLFDLPRYVEDKLKKAGIKTVDNLKEDTCSQPDKFYSFRRKTLGDKSYGSQISLICL